MNFRRSFPILLSLIFPPLLTIADAQGIEGVILSNEMPGMRMQIPGAIVKWDQGDGITTDSEGHFILPGPATWPATLRISAIGFADDSLNMNAMPVAPLTFRLAPVTQLKEAQVTERQHGTVLSTRSLQAIEAIGPKELKRAACCDLSESFETNATVDVSFSDAISGTKTIRMLGLDGKYAQIGVENIPFVRGLSSNYGLTLIPGPWINSINVSKGIGTAVNGPNAMTGQIDLCLLDPEKADRIFTNL